MEIMVQFNQITLANGVQCVMVPLVGLKSVTIEVFVKIGSKYETAGEYGMSHFLEHMAFKGTLKRKTAMDLNKEIDSKGAVHNAGTGHEWTSYYIKTINEHVDWALDVLSDILLHSTFPEEELVKERGVIIEEIRMYDDNPTMGLSYSFMEAFLKSNRGCWSITGKVEDIQAIDRKKLVNFRDAYFDPGRMVVVVTGGIGGSKAELQHLKTLLENYFGSWTGKASTLPTVEVDFSETRLVTRNKAMEQAHFCLGWPGVSSKDERRYVGKLVETIILGNSSSKLWNAIREERGLAYYLFPITEYFEELGLMGMQVGVALDRVDEAIEVAKMELGRLTTTITQTDLDRAKDYLIGKLTLSMDQSDFWSDLIGQRLLLFGETINIEDLVDFYKKVNLKQIRAFVSDFVVAEQFRLLTLKR